MTRVLKNKKLQGNKGGDVAKLFAKHFKLAQHVTYLKRTKVGTAVGTPGRLGKLLNETGNASTIHFPFKVSTMTFRPSRFLQRVGVVPYHP